MRRPGTEPSGRDPLLPPALERLQGERPDLPGFLSLWTAHGSSPVPAEIAALIAQRILSLGEPLIAYDVLQTGLQSQPGHLRLRQLCALALARAGASEKANELLSRLYAEGNEDEETLGLLGRTHKDLAASTADDAARRAHRRRALMIYERAWRGQGGYYPGINAASLSLLLGKTARARRLAQSAREACRKRLEQGHVPPQEEYWLQATLGEAALILGEREEAWERYGRAGDLGRGRWADLSSTSPPNWAPWEARAWACWRA